MRNNASVAVQFELYRFGQTVFFFSCQNVSLKYWEMNGQSVMYSANKWVHILSNLYGTNQFLGFGFSSLFAYYENYTQSSCATKCILKHKLHISEAPIDIKKKKNWVSANHDLVMSSFTLIFSGRSSFLKKKKTIYLFRVDCTVRSCVWTCMLSSSEILWQRKKNVYTQTHSFGSKYFQLDGIKRYKMKLLTRNNNQTEEWSLHG